jgi:hypothetical protein
MISDTKPTPRLMGVVWRWGKAGVFSVSSVYKHLFRNWEGEDNSQI